VSQKLNHHFVPQYHFRLFAGGKRYIHLASRDVSRFVRFASVKAHGSLIFSTVFNIWQVCVITEFLKVDGPSALCLFGPWTYLCAVELPSGYMRAPKINEL
jgi:hypothetical protein